MLQCFSRSLLRSGLRACRSTSAPASRLASTITVAESEPPAPSASSERSSGTSRNDTLCTLSRRGLLQDISSSFLHEHLTSAPRTIYLGVDPTAPSLHVGNLVPLLALFRLAQAGHRGLLVVGGATGSVGDPSGKTMQRKQLPQARLKQNAQKIALQLGEIVELLRSSTTSKGSPEIDISVLDNSDFYADLGVLDFLREVGNFSRLGEMMARDSFKSRMAPPFGRATSDAGMSFTEFSYQLLQAYDFWLLHSQAKFGHCTVQMGGSDQMGNIMAGVELIRRKLNTDQREDAPRTQTSSSIPAAFGITVPLLTTAQGEKLGKSAGNAIFLSPSCCTDFDFYQYFVRAEDADVARLLRVLTFLSDEEINGIISHSQETKMRPQHRLAAEVMKLTRGPEALRRAQRTTTLLYKSLIHTQKDVTPRDSAQLVRDMFVKESGDGTGDGLWKELRDIASTEAEQIRDMEQPTQAPASRKVLLFPSTDDQNSSSLLDTNYLALLEWSGFSTSRSEIRRWLQTGRTISVNNVALEAIEPRDVTGRKPRECEVCWLDGPEGNVDGKRRGLLFLQRGKRDAKIVMYEHEVKSTQT